jgi:alpha-galactosidase
MRRTILFLTGILLSIPSLLPALDNGLAKTPPMGWNSWNKFGCKVNEDVIRKAADAMVASGMKDAGYQYIVIDDCWQVSRDKDGNIVPDAKTFPSGIKALAEYVHSKGLKFGIYSDAGTKTCAGRPASRGYEFQDARQYAAWGVDYLKFDWCNTGTQNGPASYATMRDALLASGRPIVFSLCEWGSNKPWLWAGDVGNLWRTTGDIVDKWEGKANWGGHGMIDIVDLQVDLGSYAGPGHWNDPDMLEVGNGMSVNEDRAHFSLWCMLAAPLISGNDLRHMSPETTAILENKGAIAINQDSLGIEAFVYSATNGVEIWFKPLAGGDWAMCVLNRNKDAQKISFDWKNENVTDSFSSRDTAFATTTYAVQDLWTEKDAGTTQEPLTAEIPGHDVLLLRLKK